MISDPDVVWPDWWPACTLAKPLERTPNTGESADELILATTATLNFEA